MKKYEPASGRIFLLMLLFVIGLLAVSGCGKENGNAGSVTQIRDLDSEKFEIGVMTGAAAEHEAKKAFSKANFCEYSMPIDAFTAICSGKIDAVVLDRPTLEYMSMAHPGLAVMKENLATGRISVAAAKKSTELMQKVNEYIREYRKSRNGEMYARWFCTMNPEMPEIPKPEKPDGTLRIGVTANNEPLCFIKNGKMAGFDSEFSLRLGVYLNMKVEFVDLPYDALSAALDSGKIDLAVAFMDALPERMEHTLFSDYYIDAPITVMVRKELLKKNDLSRISCLDDLNDPDCKIASQTDILALRESKKRIPDAKYVEFNGPPDCYVALSAGKVNAFVYDRPALEYAALDRKDFIVLPENISIGHISVAANKTQTELMRQVDGFIRQYRKDGTYQQMYDRWVRTKDPVMPEIAKPQNPDGKIVIGIDSTNAPMCYLADRKETGFDVEFCERLALYLNKTVEYRNIPFDGMIPALQSGRIELSVAQMDATPERQESVLFSESYIDSYIAVLIRREDYADARNMDSGESNGIGAIFGWIRDSGVSLAESFNKTFVRESRWKLIVQGLLTTIVITVFSVLLGTVLAFPVCMMCRSKRKFTAWLGKQYVSIIMGTPILVILMILYYVIFAKVDISGIIVAILAFAMDFAAYTSVTLRSGIDGIPRGQTEAALSLGYTPSAAFFRFVLPQAVRSILPVYRSEIISTLKSTSIVGYIAIMDLTKMGDIIRSRTYEAFFPLIAIAVIYFLTAKCLTSLLIFVENRLNPEYRRKHLQKRGAK